MGPEGLLLATTCPQVSLAPGSVQKPGGIAAPASKAGSSSVLGLKGQSPFVSPDGGQPEAVAVVAVVVEEIPL